ncbi:GNAT family N-acetyltransferase [Nocardioides albidus]|uniref:GNAT family N-acetyltransferase n=1 Tax=Nocardioides albidus TaxID=1517589 RepID=A0A5C4W0Z9_9ACTN|nr:GNAT family N-acetyltransferase [Nocardioides albidus]TNM41872.1 GNAT family N-acetyltransferase [Nocardioides albidus]
MANLRELCEADLPAVEILLADALGGRRQVRLGEPVDVLDRPGVVACDGPRVVGVATWAAGDPAELCCLAVAADHRGRGIGGALVEATAAAVGPVGLWLVTTNDNLDALRVYQRHGFRIERVVVDGVAHARRLKPGIPLVGSHGIPLLDELVLRRPAPAPDAARGRPRDE